MAGDVYKASGCQAASSSVGSMVPASSKISFFLLFLLAKLAGVSIVGQKNNLNERGWEPPISIPKHVPEDLNIPNTQEREDRFHLWENDPLKRSLESSSLKGTPESHAAEVLHDPVIPPVQRRKLDPLPKRHRYFSKTRRAKRTKKNKRKVKKEAHCTCILPTPSVPPESEEEAVEKKLTLPSFQEVKPDLPNEELKKQPDESVCLMHQECQHKSCELSVSQEPGPSSPTVTSLASPPLCFGRFLSCVCQTFSRSRKERLPRRKGSKESEAGDDAKTPRPGLLKGLAKNKVQPDQNL
nr:uncharacterized protein LOC101412177 [Dasypus novemcinctus]